MDILTPQDLLSLSIELALFVTSDGILIEEATNSPLMPFRTAAPYITIRRAFRENGLLVIQGNPAPNLPFRVVPPKFFLRETTSEIQNRLIRAHHLIMWDKKTQHCSACGAFLEPVIGTTEKKCPACAHSFFPSLSPAVIVLVTRGSEILLARSPHFPLGMYSALAGFVDLGESAEIAAHREIQEEVGITIRNLQYFGSQSWPFPASFMIAFTAEYAGGDLCPDQNEIEDARWFPRHTLPDVPPLPSIARELIEHVIQRS